MHNLLVVERRTPVVLLLCCFRFDDHDAMLRTNVIAVIHSVRGRIHYSHCSQSNGNALDHTSLAFKGIILYDKRSSDTASDCIPSIPHSAQGCFTELPVSIDWAKRSPPGPGFGIRRVVRRHRPGTWRLSLPEHPPRPLDLGKSFQNQTLRRERGRPFEETPPIYVRVRITKLVIKTIRLSWQDH